MNKALKTKWLCKYATKDDALWKKWLYPNMELKVFDGRVRGALMHTGSIVENLSRQI